MTDTRTRTVRLRPDLTLTLTEAGTGRTVLLLHGGGGPVTVQNIADHLAGTMHVITPTHPGWDAPDAPNGSPESVTSHSPTSSCSRTRDSETSWSSGPRSAGGSAPRWPCARTATSPLVWS